MERSARERGTGIVKRSPQSLCKKIYSLHAVITTTLDGDWVGFWYIQTWQEGAFVSNSGLIVRPEYRGKHVTTRIKEVIFELARNCYPGAKVFSITTGAAVLALNHQLGFRPVSYAEITTVDAFWVNARHVSITLC